MKFFLCLTVLAVALCSVLATKEEWKKKMEEIKAECKNQYPEDSTADMSDSKKNCYTGCIFEHLNLISASGTFSKEKCDEIAKKRHEPHPEMLKKAEEVCAKCNEEVKTTDKCLTGPALKTCFETHGKELGLPTLHHQEKKD